MRARFITTQEQLDEIHIVEKDEQVYIQGDFALNSKLSVFGFLKIEGDLDCYQYRIYAWSGSRVESLGSAYIVAWGSAMVEAGGNCHVKARERSHVVAREGSTVFAFDDSTISAFGASRVVAYGKSSVDACDGTVVEAFESSHVEAWADASVVAYERSTVEAWDHSEVVAWDSAVVRVFSGTMSKLQLRGFCTLILSSESALMADYSADETVAVLRYQPLTYLERHGIPVVNGKVVVYKRVSSEFKTMENTPNETVWAVGSMVTHPNWKPRGQECGEGKFHACARPYFCDEFRTTPHDKYVAIQVKVDDLYEWPDAIYPHKIAFREGRVLYECDRFGMPV